MISGKAQIVRTPPFHEMQIARVIDPAGKIRVLVIDPLDQFVPAIDETYPLSETAAALTYLLDGRAKGKVVISQP